MNIEVTGCHDCPFAECDYDGTLEYWCGHFRGKEALNVNDCFESEILHPSCPLKQDSITVKLATNDKKIS